MGVLVQAKIGENGCSSLVGVQSVFVFLYNRVEDFDRSTRTLDIPSRCSANYKHRGIGSVGIMHQQSKTTTCTRYGGGSTQLETNYQRVSISAFKALKVNLVHRFLKDL